MPPITVTLQDFQDIDADGKRTAERKFMHSLERSFPDPGEMLECFKAFQNALDSDGTALSKEETKRAQRFQVAFEKARVAGFQQLGASEEAYFDLRLA